MIDDILIVGCCLKQLRFFLDVKIVVVWLGNGYYRHDSRLFSSADLHIKAFSVLGNTEELQEVDYVGANVWKNFEKHSYFFCNLKLLIDYRQCIRVFNRSVTEII